MDAEKEERHQRNIIRVRERARIYMRKRRADPEYRAAEAKINAARNRKYRSDLMLLLGDKCAACGFTDARALQIDHINGGGKKERRVHGGRLSMYIHHLKNPERTRKNLQILCANCNFIKIAELRESSGSGRPRTEKTASAMGRVSHASEYNRKRRERPEFRIEENKKNLERNLKYRTDLIILLGEKCRRCGFSDIRALQLDHVQGDGTKEHDERGNTAMYYNYLKHPEEAKEKLQILCANCNWIERAENHEIKPFGRPRTVGLQTEIS